MSADLSKIRIGSYSSSEVYRLLSLSKDKQSFGKPALTYIKQKQYEQKLGRSIHSNVNARPTSWGHICELHAFGLLGTEYSLNSDETLQHPTLPFLVGTPDGFKYGKEKTVIDIKSPFTMGSFCELVEPIYAGLTGMDAMNWIRDNHSDGEKYYQQLLSNAMITGCTHAELVIYCPYERELDDIRKLAADAPPELTSEYYWLNFALNNELPYLHEGGYYRNLNSITFPIPDTDREILEYAITKASEYLTPSIITATYDQAAKAVIVDGVINK